MIAQDTVQQILETAKIEDVVGDYVNLKRRGVNMIGLCPFHNEKTPSFTVSPTKNIFKCFGCGKGGNPVQFLMEHENCSFPEALRTLAAKYGIKIEEKELTPEERKKQQHKDSLYIVNEYAQKFYANQLFNTPLGKSIGRGYFKERGYNDAIIEKFGLGYAPEGKDAFTQTAVQKGYSIELLRSLGLTTKYDSDFFRGRVMFTIHNLSGKPIAFAGRILQKNVKAPKYINSPETEIYVKNKVLYGAYFAKQAIRKQDECILVEGYTDVISLHQAGLENVVASSGTSLTVGQIQLIKRYTPNIKILYDGDPAGIKAALRGLDLVLEQDMNVRVVLLPEGEDPDSQVKKLGSTAFEEYITEHAQDFILFKTNLLIEEAANDPIKKAGLVKDIVASIAKVPDPIKRAFYVKECANLMDLEESILISEANRVVAGNVKRANIKRNRPQERPASPLRPETGEAAPTTSPSKPQKKQNSTGDEFQEKDIIRIIITAGDVVFDEEEDISVAEYVLSNIEDVLDNFDNALYQEVAKEAFQRLVNKQRLDLNYFLMHDNPKIKQLALNVTTSPYDYSPGWDKKEIYLRSQKMPELNFTDDSVQSLMRFKYRKLIRMCEDNQKRLKEIKDPDEMMTLLQVQQQLIDMRNTLAAEFKTVVIK